MCEAYEITHVRTPAYSPWRNGRAERMIRTVKQLLRKLLTEDGDVDWSTVLPQVQGALNFSVSRVMGFSPAEVFLGMQPELPFGVRVE